MWGQQGGNQGNPGFHAQNNHQTIPPTYGDNGPRPQGNTAMGSNYGISSGQIYKIVSVCNQKYCLDASGDSSNRGKLILYTYHGGPNQHFKLQQNSNGYYLIVNCQTGGALEVPTNFKEPGGQCYIDDSIYSDSQTWRLLPGQNNDYSIVMSDGQFCLDAKGGSISDCTPIILWLTQRKPHQTWNILPA